MLIYCLRPANTVIFTIWSTTPKVWTVQHSPILCKVIQPKFNVRQIVSECRHLVLEGMNYHLKYGSKAWMICFCFLRLPIKVSITNIWVSYELYKKSRYSFAKQNLFQPFWTWSKVNTPKPKHVRICFVVKAAVWSDT